MAVTGVLGRLTRDPQTRNTQNGDMVVDIDVAESWKDRQGNEQVAYYRASFWNNAGRTINQYFHKGSPISLSGELHPRIYQDRNGNNRMSLDIDNPHFKFVPAPPKNRNNQGNQGYQQSPQWQQGGYQQNNQSGYQNNQGYQQNNPQQLQGQPNNGYQQNPQQGQQQPPQPQQTQLGGNSWADTTAGQKRAQVNQQGQAQEISDDDLPFPTQGQETPF